MENNKIVEVKDQPMPLIEMALKNNASIETLEKLMALQERWEAGKAKKAFNEAMANFQGECPVIKKKTNGGKTESGIVAYKYAELGNIVDQVRGLLQKNGLSYSIKTTFAPNEVSAVCIAKHLDGHSEESEVKMPLAGKTKMMNDPQQIGATITYAKRYAFCNAFGIMTEGEDKDAIVAPRGNNQTTGASAPADKPKMTIEQLLIKIRETKNIKGAGEWRQWIANCKLADAQKNILMRALEEVEKGIKK